MATKATHTITGRVAALRRRTAGSFGNPAWIVAIVTEDGYGEIYDTAANASLGYQIGNSEFRESTHTFELNSRRQITRVIRDAI